MIHAINSALLTLQQLVGDGEEYSAALNLASNRHGVPKDAIMAAYIKDLKSIAGQQTTKPTLNRRYYVTGRNDTRAVECWEKCEGRGLFESFGYPGISVRIIACGLKKTEAENLKRILEREVTLTLMDNFDIDGANDTRINCPIPLDLPRA